MDSNLRAENRMLKEQLEIIVNENKQLKEELYTTRKFILEEQQQRIDKAIEHIKAETKNNTFYEWYDGEVKDLLEILGDKENE